jgi:plasmid stabilization system protein ParE
VKRYEVVVTPEAELDIVAAFRYIRERSPVNAERWLRALYAGIGTLEGSPSRCARAPESEYFDEVLRQMVFKSHRVIFRIEEPQRVVRILHFRHGRQRPVGQLHAPNE